MRRGMTRTAVAAIALVAVACGNDREGPTSASRASATTTTSTGTATPTTSRPTVLRGSVSALAGTCPTLTFTLSATKVSTTASTTFAGGACTDLANGTLAAVEGAPQSDGSVMAARVLIERTNAQTPPAAVQGTVASLTGTCPTLMFVVGSTTVTTSSTTSFEGAGCVAIVAGEFVAAEGTRNTDGSIAAAHVVAATATPQPASARGTVAVLSGTCPTLTFTLGMTTVTTTSMTDFGGQGCAAVVNSVEVAVEGTRASDGSITATRVFVAPPAPTRLHGAVSGLTGTCPALTFMVSGTTVSTSSSTEFVGGSCSAVVNGVSVAVDGATTNGTVTARRVVVGQGHSGV